MSHSPLNIHDISLLEKHSYRPIELVVFCFENPHDELLSPVIVFIIYVWQE